MSPALRTYVRRRRLRRWLQREALLLERESRMFGCPEADRAAHSLLRMVS